MLLCFFFFSSLPASSCDSVSASVGGKTNCMTAVWTNTNANRTQYANDPTRSTNERTSGRGYTEPQKLIQWNCPTSDPLLRERGELTVSRFFWLLLFYYLTNTFFCACILGFFSYPWRIGSVTHGECRFCTCGSSALDSDGTRRRLSVPVCFWIQRRSQIPWNAVINVGHM